MRGRKPKPTEAKKLAGNPGKRPLNQDEPKLPAASIEAPTHLDGEARVNYPRFWDVARKQDITVLVLRQTNRIRLP